MLSVNILDRDAVKYSPRIIKVAVRSVEVEPGLKETKRLLFKTIVKKKEIEFVRWMNRERDIADGHGVMPKTRALYISVVFVYTTRPEYTRFLRVTFGP